MYLATASDLVPSHLSCCHLRSIRRLNKGTRAAMSMVNFDWKQLLLLSFHLLVQRRVQSIVVAQDQSKENGQ
jgi:hypothetical protein